MSDEETSGTDQELPRYKCHKEVHALKIASIQSARSLETNEVIQDATIIPADEDYAPFPVSADYMNKHNPKPGGYFVVYADGYQSFSPAEAFESGYTLIS